MNCAYCNKTFLVVASRVERTKYCSRVCKFAARSVQIQHECLSCGKMFATKASKKSLYCSRECGYNARVKPLHALTQDQYAIIARYQSLVASVARKMYFDFHPRSMDYDDFYQEGIIGLITAIQQDTDPTKKEQFAGFAKVHIRSAILAAYRTKEHAIRLPESLFRNDANVSSEQLAQYLSLVSSASMEMLPVGSRYAVHDGTSPEQKVIDTERITLLYQALQQLPEQQRQLIAEHYGLTGQETAMLQLCHRYNIPRATMHRIVHRGLDRMRVSLEGIA